MEVLFEGADVGTEPDHPEPMPFERSLPLAKALHPDTLLAFRMNGEVLDPIHGYPLRLFVPGWYGVASVKWLRRIEVVNQPFRGYFQSVKYTVQRHDRARRRNGDRRADDAEVGDHPPARGDVLGLGGNRLFGVAWAGEDSVSRVEVSTDGGATWSDATLDGTAGPVFVDAVGVSVGGGVAGRTHDPGAGHVVARPGAAGGARPAQRRLPDSPQPAAACARRRRPPRRPKSPTRRRSCTT